MNMVTIARRSRTLTLCLMLAVKGVGTGLGLTICHQIVQIHHATIDLASESHKESTFTILIPTNLDVSMYPRIHPVYGTCGTVPCSNNR
ncbi:MAG: hypothetical protein Kow0074_07910 [Candidatus Zixiibacteriota bacterium]